MFCNLFYQSKLVKNPMFLELKLLPELFGLQQFFFALKYWMTTENNMVMAFVFSLSDMSHDIHYGVFCWLEHYNISKHKFS